MYIRFVTFRFPSQNKAEAFVSMMSTPLWQEKFEKETKSMEQILIRSGEGRLAGMGIYKSEEDFAKSSKMLIIPTGSSVNSQHTLFAMIQ